MKKIIISIIAIVLLQNCGTNNSIEIDNLRKEIQTVLRDKKATVGISVWGKSPKDTISINGDIHLPMQSIYKFHIATAVLHEVDKGKLNLNDTIELTNELLDNPLWSVIKKEYPEGGKIELKEVIKYTVANSDNIGCDILLDLIGGPKVVEDYMHKNGISEIAIRHNEKTMQKDWELQYLNWTTANAANKTLKTFFENRKNQISSESHTFLWDVMKQSWLGEISMKTYLPEKTKIAHKTGHSGKNDKGITGAQNDVGLIFLPNGDHFYLSILISNSTEESEVNKKIIADISKLTYDYFTKELN